MKLLKSLLVFFLFTTIISAQSIMLGPRLTGNFNNYNQKGLTGSWNGLGIGIGAQVDISFSSHLGMMIDLNVFDMRNFSYSSTANNVVTDYSYTLSYLTIDPMFKLEFSGFYMVAGPSLGMKLSSSGEETQTQTGQAPVVNPRNLDTKSVRFDIAVGTGYNFKVSPGLVLGSDFMAYIPLTDTYNFPGLSNSVLTLKLGVSVKFAL